jgi:hypothetical protein
MMHACQCSFFGSKALRSIQSTCQCLPSLPACLDHTGPLALTLPVCALVSGSPAAHLAVHAVGLRAGPLLHCVHMHHHLRLARAAASWPAVVPGAVDAHGLQAPR